MKMILFQQLFSDHQKLQTKATDFQRDLAEATRHMNELANDNAKVKVCRKIHTLFTIIL
jgi:hypothetical protein